MIWVYEQYDLHDYFYSTCNLKDNSLNDESLIFVHEIWVDWIKEKLTYIEMKDKMKNWNLCMSMKFALLHWIEEIIILLKKC